MKECIFCKIIKGELPSYKVYEDEKVVAFEDINPISKGHTLVIPKIHAENIWDIPEDYLLAIYRAAKKLSDAIKKALNPVGIAFLQLNGKGAGQVIPHYHLHIIPRSPEEPELPVSKWEMKPGDKEEIKRIAEKISDALK